MKVFTLPKIKSVFSRKILFDLYVTKKKPVSYIAKFFNCSENKVNYWLSKHQIQKRTISEAIYQLKNPLGDPFIIRKPENLEEGVLFGIGLGLYWGEGSKRGQGGMKITNTDIKMMKKFIDFLETFFTIDRHKLRFSLHIFKDLSEEKCIGYWSHGLGVEKNQFYKVIRAEVRGNGTYKYRSEYGVIIMQFNNVKLKRILCEMIENIK